MTDHIYTTNREIERARALWEKGILLAERTEGFYTLKLYQMHDIYAEVVWHTHFNVAMKVTTFSDTDRLQPYLEDISLEGLFN
ncbi:MAG TPA: hypothetical protein VEX65_08585 [Flavisolibacter sp.]|jgi:hypothetical protein|nr:hypothetical protein [Flavisolibacter sp.]